MSLLTIAELLAGEAVVTPGGAVDRETAAADDVLLWQGDGATPPVAEPGDATPQGVVEELLVTV